MISIDSNAVTRCPDSTIGKRVRGIIGRELTSKSRFSLDLDLDLDLGFELQGFPSARPAL